jgi:hypothetical protein
MRNTARGQEKNALVWQFLIREAKLRLLDATEADERGEWRRVVKNFELLRHRGVELPSRRPATQN